MLFGYFCCPSTTYYTFSVTGECILISSYVFKFWDKTGVSTEYASSVTSVTKNIGCIFSCF